MNREQNNTKRQTDCLSARNKKNPYERFAYERLILRDHLAIDRTVLANERTFLAYGRTGLALVLTGAAYMRFFDSSLTIITGWGFIVFGAAVGVFGIWRSVTMARRIRALDNNLTEAEQNLRPPAQPANE